MREPVKGRSEAGRAREQKARETRQRIVGAAVALFLDVGYTAATVDAMAEHAGVSAGTIYQAFGTKQAVLERAIDVALAGDDEPIAVLERSWVTEARKEPDPLRRLQLVVCGASAIAARVAPLRGVLRDAAAVEPGLRIALDENHRRRRESQGALVEILAESHKLRSPLTIERASDIFFALVSSETHELLVTRCGWTLSMWQDWLVSSIERELFDSPVSRTSAG